MVLHAALALQCQRSLEIFRATSLNAAPTVARSRSVPRSTDCVTCWPTTWSRSGSILRPALCRALFRQGWYGPSQCRRTLRIVRPRPAVLLVQRVADSAERLRAARRRDVQAPAFVPVDPRPDHMHLAVAVLAVQHGRPLVAASLQPGQDRPLELVQRVLNLRVRRAFVGMPVNHTRRVAMPVLVGICNCRRLLRIAAQPLDLGSPLAVVARLARPVPGHRIA